MRRPRVELCCASLLAWAGCTAHPRIAHPPLAPPQGAETIEAADGVALHFEVRASTKQPRGVIYFVLGPEIGASELYPEFSRVALDAGFALATVHPRGSGFSPGVRGDIRKYGLVLGDLRLGWEEVNRRYPDVPAVLFGHSAGGPLALEVAVSSRVAPSAIVLVNPAYKLRYADGMGPTTRDYFVYGFDFVFRRGALTVDMNRDPSAVVFDADRVAAEAMHDDPFVVRYFSLRYLSAVRRVMKRSRKNAAKVVAPLLVVQGQHDALVDPAGNDELLQAAASEEKSKLLAPDGGHGASAVDTVSEALVVWLDQFGVTRR